MTALVLKRPRPPKALISLVPMIDVLLILLVFFMVTSTYLNLDMIPAVTRAGEPSGGATQEEPAPTLLIRLGADGTPAIQGRAVSPAELDELLRTRLSADPLTQVVVLPSGGASMQALVSVMDTATRAGATRLRVIRLEARP